MRALITGITGFVGQHLAQLLLQKNDEVWGTTRYGCPDSVLNPKVNIVMNNLMDESGILKLLNRIQPDVIYHLAGQSNVKRSWENKLETFEANVTCTVNLLEAVRKSDIANRVKVLTIGSSEEYGKVASDQMPIRENTLLQPISPYGISKSAVAHFTNQYHSAHQIQVVHARPFNHIGPGQGLGFVVTDFSKQIVDIEKGLKENILYVGNLDSYRDFTDVRDIVEAYHILMTIDDVKFGDIYNICSGNSISIQQVLDMLIGMANTPIRVEKDMSRMRPSDIPIYIGDNTKISSLGWNAKISLEQTLNEVLSTLRNLT